MRSIVLLLNRLKPRQGAILARCNTQHLTIQIEVIRRFQNLHKVRLDRHIETRHLSRRDLREAKAVSCRELELPREAMQPPNPFILLPSFSMSATVFLVSCSVQPAGKKLGQSPVGRCEEHVGLRRRAGESCARTNSQPKRP